MNEQPSLIPGIQTTEVMPRQIKDMHQVHGTTPGKTCKTCVHLLRIQYSKYYLKCEMTRMTHGAATDWKAGYPACGLHEEGQRKTLLAPK